MGSRLLAARPFRMMTCPSPSSTTTDGMPLILNFLDEASFRCLSVYGSAGQCFSPKYSWEPASSRSDETKTTSKPFAFKSSLYHFANCGAKLRRGGGAPMGAEIESHGALARERLRGGDLRRAADALRAQEQREGTHR